MNRFVLPFALATALTALPAQQREFGGVLLVRHGAGDLVLNKPLLDALLREPALEARLRELTTDRGHPIPVHSDLPAAHLPGTFQVHLRGTMIAAEWDAAQAERALDATVAHLHQRLSFLLHDQPRAELEALARELRQRCEELGARRARRQQQCEAAAERVASLEARLREAERELQAVRIDAATDERAAKELEHLAREHRQRREELAATHARMAARVRALEERLAHLSQEAQEVEAQLRPGTDATPLRNRLTDLRRDAGKVAEELDQLRAEREAAAREAADAERVLAAALEQLPATTLALQRARVRAASLEAQQRLHAEELAAARDEAARQFAAGEGIEQDSIDLTVHRALLTEVQGKLARLEPVRFELLRE